LLSVISQAPIVTNFLVFFLKPIVVHSWLNNAKC
jgi:hypothetical protein